MPYLIPYLIPVAVLIGFWHGQTWPLRTVLLAFALVVILDLLTGGDRSWAPARSRSAAGRMLFDRLALWMWLPAQGLMVAIGLAATADPSLPSAELAVIVICVGMTGGMLAAPAAHELMHGRSRAERAIATLQMALLSYAHFCVEHVQGHHARVATTEDPATARLGESVYAYYPRAVWGGFASAWRLEAERLRRQGRPVLSARNRVVRGLALEAFIYAAIAGYYGLAGVVFFAAQSVIGLSIVETFNYIQHYGLLRNPQADGRYERAAVQHSWNANHPVSNWFTLNLGRHSHHHCHAHVTYGELDWLASAPRLPTGLYGMWMLALLPPLWFAVMDPLVETYRARQSARQAQQISR